MLLPDQTPAPASQDAALFLEAVAGAHKGLSVSLEVRRRDDGSESHAALACASFGIPGTPSWVFRTASANGVESSDRAAADVLVSVRSWLVGECDQCLGGHQVPGDVRGVLAPCGCQMGGD